MVKAKGARSLVIEIWETAATAALPTLGEARPGEAPGTILHSVAQSTLEGQ